MLRFKCSHPLGVEVPTDTYVSQCLYGYICISMLVQIHMYLHLYVLALKQPFKDHLPVVLECFHHLLLCLVVALFSVDLLARFFFFVRAPFSSTWSQLCAVLSSLLLFFFFLYIFSIFFSVFFLSFFLFSVVAVCCLYKASNLVVYHIRTLLLPSPPSHIAPLFSCASSSICWLLL